MHEIADVISADAMTTARPSGAADTGSARARSLRTEGFGEREVALGPKMAQLHARRQRLSASRPITSCGHAQGCDDLTIASDDGTLAYVLQPTASGLHVERIQRRPLGTHLVHHMLFRSAESFAGWCDSEPVRFEHPTIFSRLRRRGDELLRGTR